MPDLYISDSTPEVDSTTHPLKRATPGQVELKTTEPHILTCFHEMPEGVAFENQREDEKFFFSSAGITQPIWNGKQERSSWLSYPWLS